MKLIIFSERIFWLLFENKYVYLKGFLEKKLPTN